jgi:phosphoglycerate kinase
MPVTAATMQSWIAALLGADQQAQARRLEDYLSGIPRLDALADVPSGTPVLVRGDLDVKLGPRVGDGDERLQSMLETLRFGRQRGWKQVLFGHVGRKPEGTLAPVAARLSQLLEAPVEFLGDWLDESKTTIQDAVPGAIRRAPPGGILLLENTRKYKIECLLWKATAADAAKLSEPLAQLANQFAERVARVYVNEALSAGSPDASSTIVPAAMDRVALGRYVAGEFDGPMLRCRQAQLVVFSGVKIEKLDDLEAIIDRGVVRMVLAGGSLAMALKKAAAAARGEEFHLGVAEDPAHQDKPYYIPPERIPQAARMLQSAARQKIEVVLPVDFVLADGSTSATIGPGRQQFDVGEETSKLFARKLDEFIAAHRGQSPPAVAFHNGVLGMFEKEPFERGTKAFIGDLKRLKDAGLEVYVGGGEGGKALELYGQPDWVTHCFTAGGTVLNALGGQPVPYLLALYMAAGRK